MLKWLAKMFEKMCSVCIVANFVIGGIVGGSIGIGSSIGNGNIFIILPCIIGGLIIAFFINIMGFGFLAQIIEIRKKVDSLAKNSEVNK